MSSSHSVLLLLASALLLTACETLPPPPATFDASFSSADANHDDRVTREELADFTAYQLFLRRDANHDRRLTLQEWWPNADHREREIFDKRDDNHDDVVTLNEARRYSREDPAVAETIRLADRNGDGVASWKEINAYLGGH